MSYSSWAKRDSFESVREFHDKYLHFTISSILMYHVQAGVSFWRVKTEWWPCVRVSSTIWIRLECEHDLVAWHWYLPGREGRIRWSNGYNCVYISLDKEKTFVLHQCSLNWKRSAASSHETNSIWFLLYLATHHMIIISCFGFVSRQVSKGPCDH